MVQKHVFVTTTGKKITSFEYATKYELFSDFLCTDTFNWAKENTLYSLAYLF